MSPVWDCKTSRYIPEAAPEAVAPEERLPMRPRAPCLRRQDHPDLVRFDLVAQSRSEPASFELDSDCIP